MTPPTTPDKPTFASHFRQLRANRWGNAALGAVAIGVLAIGVTQVMMALGFG